MNSRDKLGGTFRRAWKPTGSWFFVVASFLITISSAYDGAGAEGTNLDLIVVTPESRHDLIAGYEALPGSYTNDRLLAVGAAYAVETNYAKALAVYAKYLQGHPDDKQVLRAEGAIYCLQERYQEALGPSYKAWSMGDTNALQMLAASWLGLKQYDQLTKLLPDLLVQMRTNIGVVNCVIAYSLDGTPRRPDLLVEAVNSVPDDQIRIVEETAHLMEQTDAKLWSNDEANEEVHVVASKIIRGYLADENSWATECLPGVADAFRFEGHYATAELLYRRFLKAHPDDGPTLVMVGEMNLCRSNLVEAKLNLRRAWSLGVTNSLKMLAAAYETDGDYDGVTDLVPAMLEQRHNNLEVLNELLIYSLKHYPEDRELFYKALDGVSNDQILRDENTANTVLKGYNIFGDQKRYDELVQRNEELLQKQRQQDKRLGG